MAAEKLPLFSVAVKDTKQIDHLVFKAADLDTKTTSWKVEIHDQSWPHTKTLTYEVKKLTKSSDWDTLTVRIRPQKEGRMLAWRATYVAGSVQGAWSPDWTPVVPADERQRDLDTGNKKWEKIFAPYVPMIAMLINCVAEKTKAHSVAIISVVFSPDGTKIVSGSEDKTIKVWDSDKLEMLSEKTNAHSDCIKSVAFSPDGTKIVSGSYDKTIKVWDSDALGLLSEKTNAHSRVINSVAFSPDGTKIVSGSYDKTIKVWDSDDLELLSLKTSAHSREITSVAFSPDGTKIVSGSYDKTIKVWDSGKLEMLSE
eukprot:jgi/Chrpa1/8388/Chrysochromulina_OHIO_Genome00012649-RA